MKKSFWLLSICLILAVAFSPLVTDAGRKKVKITDIKAGSGAEYVEGKGGLEVGAKYYIDRDYVVLEMPEEMEGIQWIMTGNGDKQSKGKDFLTFKVDVPSIIWVAHDSRGEEDKGGTPPDWLVEDYEMQKDGKDPLALTVTDGNMATFNLWKIKESVKGKVAVPGNAEKPAAGHGSNYLVLVEFDDKAPVDSKGKLSSVWGDIKGRINQ